LIHLHHETEANTSQCGAFHHYGGAAYRIKHDMTDPAITCKRCLAYIKRHAVPSLGIDLSDMTADGTTPPAVNGAAMPDMTVGGVLATKAAAAVDLTTADAVRVRAHLDAVLAKINTPHAARVFWQHYNAARTGDSWADADAAISTAARFANGAALLSPELIDARYTHAIDYKAFKHGRREPLAARLNRLAERVITAFDTNPNGGTN
jgi:hypothetical protein